MASLCFKCILILTTIVIFTVNDSRQVEMPKQGFRSSLRPAFLQLAENFEWDELERFLPKFMRVFAGVFMEPQEESPELVPNSLLKDVLLPFEHEAEIENILDYINQANVVVTFRRIEDMNKNFLHQLSLAKTTQTVTVTELQEVTMQLLSFIDFANLQRDLQDLVNKDGGFFSFVTFLKDSDMGSAYGRLKGNSRMKEFISLLRLNEGYAYDLYSGILRYMENFLGWDKFGNDWMDFHAIKKQWKEEDIRNKNQEPTPTPVKDDQIPQINYNDNERAESPENSNDNNSKEQEKQSKLRTLVGKLMSFPPRPELKEGGKPRELEKVLDHVNELEEYALTRAWIIKIVSSQEDDKNDEHFSKVWTIMEYQRALITHEAKLLLKELEFFLSEKQYEDGKEAAQKKFENLEKIITNVQNEPSQFTSDEEAVKEYGKLKDEL